MCFSVCENALAYASSVEVTLVFDFERFVVEWRIVSAVDLGVVFGSLGALDWTLGEDMADARGGRGRCVGTIAPEVRRFRDRR